MFRKSIGLILYTFLWRAAECQPATSFEAASIRLSKDTKAHGGIEFAPGGERFIATAVPLATLIMTAYGLTVPQCVCQGPFPVLTQRFDVDAKADHSVNASEMLRLLQALLVDRFKLQIHRESKYLPAYALVPDKTGARLKQSDVPHGNDSAPLNLYRARGTERSQGDLIFRDESMQEFAWRLTTLSVLDGYVVVDQTGLKGHYDFALKYTTESGDSDFPPIFTAVREQLGLRLEPRKLPLEVIVIEHAEIPSAN